MGTFYIPPLIKDNNVLKSFEDKVLKNYKRNRELYKNIDNTQIDIFKWSATDLSKIQDDSVDYIYTDPPYADVISYAELNIVWESWLNIKTDTNQEMIISPTEGKTKENYFLLLGKFLNEISLKLKKGRVLTLIFHHPNFEIWKLLQEEFLKSNFTPVISEDPIRIISSNKTSSQRSTTKHTQCFLAMNFINTKNKSFSVNDLMPETINHILIEIERKNLLTDADKYDYIINYLFPRYKIPDDFTF